MRSSLAILSLACWLCGAPPAAAHARLKRSSPPQGAVLDRAPTEIVLTFNSEVERKYARFVLRDADGRERALAGPAGSGLVTELTLAPGALAPGAYQLRWSVVSRDGHRITGTVRFTVR